MSSSTSVLSEYSRPSINGQSGHYTLMIGYRMRDDGKRVRANYTFGRDANLAIAAAVAKQREWEIVVRDWPERRAVLQSKLPKFDWSKPVWNDSPPIARLIHKLSHALFAPDGEIVQMEERVQRHAEEDDASALALIERRNPRLLDKYRPEPPRADDVTIFKAKDLFLAAKREQVGLAGGKGIKPRTYNSVNKLLAASLGLSIAKGEAKVVRNPIDVQKPLRTLTKDDLKGFVHFWMSLPDGIEVRTAANYCKQFKSLLDWCADEEGLSFNWPKGAEKLFRFRNIHRYTIAEYDAEILKKLLHNASERLKLFILLGLQCGYYQQDIADLRHDDLVQHKGDWCLWRARSKTSHQNDFETLHYLWPETLELLLRHRARINNRFGLLLLNHAGLPLIREDVDRSQTDAISDRYRVLRRKLGINLAFRQLRKLGWNEIKRISGSTDVARKYAGQVISGVARHYNRDDFDDVTEVLKKWYAEIKSSGVV